MKYAEFLCISSVSDKIPIQTVTVDQPFSEILKSPSQAVLSPTRDQRKSDKTADKRVRQVHESTSPLT